MRWLGALGVLFAILGLGVARGGAPKANSGVVTENDILYGKGGDEELRLDLARPAGKGPHAAVVCIHGGGWRGGKRQDLAKLTDVLAKQGFVAVTVTYRLTPKHQFPAQIEDCKAAVRWLRAHADKYGIRKDRIGAVGFSAGGHLACLLGTADEKCDLEGNGGHAEHSSRIQAVVSFFGPTDFTTKHWDKKVEDFFLVPFLGGTFEEKTDLYKKCSPIVYASKDDPPFLFFHGTNDTLVKIDESQKLTKKLNDLGGSARLVTMENDGHGWGGEKLTRTLEETVTFFESKLKK